MHQRLQPARDLSQPMKRIGLAALVLVWSSPALAEEPPPEGSPAPAPAPDEKSAGEVRIIGNKADSLQKVPGSGTVITPEVMPIALGEANSCLPSCVPMSSPLPTRETIRPAATETNWRGETST